MKPGVHRDFRHGAVDRRIAPTLHRSFPVGSGTTFHRRPGDPDLEHRSACIQRLTARLDDWRDQAEILNVWVRTVRADSRSEMERTIELVEMDLRKAEAAVVALGECTDSEWAPVWSAADEAFRRLEVGLRVAMSKFR